MRGLSDRTERHLALEKRHSKHAWSGPGLRCVTIAILVYLAVAHADAGAVLSRVWASGEEGRVSRVGEPVHFASMGDVVLGLGIGIVACGLVSCVACRRLARRRFERTAMSLEEALLSYIHANGDLHAEMAGLRRAEEDARTLLGRLEFILGEANTGVDVVSSDYELLYVDPQRRRIYGDYRGKKCHEYFVDSDKVCPGCGVKKALETKGVVMTEQFLVREDNRYAQITTIPFQTESGDWLVGEVNADIAKRKEAEDELLLHRNNLEELVAERTADLRIANRDLQREMAERMRAEDALRGSEEKYRVLFEQTADARLIIEGFEFRDCNDAAVRMLRYFNKEAFLPCHPAALSPEYQPDGSLSRDKADELMALAYETGSACFEWEHRRADGSELFVEIIMTSIPTGDKRILHVGWRDVTERKKAESELARLRNYLRNVIDSMPSVLVGVDRHGRVTQWNREAEKSTGLAAERAVGRELGDAFPQLGVEMPKVRRAMETLDIQSDSKVVRRVGEDSHVFDVTVYPLTANGIEGAVIRVDDVTERVRMEEMIAQSERMFSVGGLAAGMAHEINNPLAGILQSVQVVRNRVSQGHEKNRVVAEDCGTSIQAVEAYVHARGILSMLDAVADSGKRAARVVNDVLSFSRKGEGEFGFNDLCEVLDGSVEAVLGDHELGGGFDFGGVEIARDYDSGMPRVWCEARQMRQVFLSVLKNALQAVAEHAEGDVPRLVLSVKRDTLGARVEISDNGPGMDEATRRRVFEPFFTTRNVGFGTGLGLSVSYYIVAENHGGTMSVVSEPGKGATFIIRLPLERVAR